MTETVRTAVRQAAEELIEATTSSVAIQKSFETHRAKVHFTPSKYRVLGGLLQSLNIKFGNFLEKLFDLVIQSDGNVERHPRSGSKFPLRFTADTDARIDAYITSRQLPESPDRCDEQFEALLESIVETEQDETKEKQVITKDIDALFQPDTKNYVYVEIKYNDDHDTGKFIDINRKFIKAFAGLVNELEIDARNQLKPILYYFNPTKRYGPIYVPSSNIYRGSRLFDEYFETKYEDVDNYLREIGDDPEIIRMFDNMYERVRNYDA
ncbi:MAG: HinfI family type II restriction enzyme [Woeseia sp.]